MSRDARIRLMYEVSRRRARGESIRGIARALGIARKTVRRLLSDLEERRTAGDDVLGQAASKRSPRPSKLDPYVDVITELVQKYPDIRATRLHEELSARGFDGKYTIVREYLKKIRPRPKKRAYNVVETPPGKQAQVDWSTYALADGTPVYAFSCILSYSRYQYIHFCSDMRQPTLFRQLMRAFAYHGGLAQEYVFDSMPGIVDRWEFGSPVLNLRAVDFAAYHGIALHIAPRGDGPYKGKVERIFWFTEESLLNARTFHTLAELNTTCDWWLKKRCNVREHTRTRRRPLDALADENLAPLPTNPYDDRELAHRIVDSYSYVRFDGNFYRVPDAHVGRWVYVRASDSEVTVVSGAATVIARHPRGPRNERLYIPPPEKRRRPHRRPIAVLLTCFDAWGADVRRFADNIRRNKRYASMELERLLQLRTTWTAEDILRAIEHAARYAAYSADAVEHILEATAKPRTLEDQLAEGARRQIQQAMATSPVVQRDLAAYARLLSGAPDHSDDSETPDARSQADDALQETRTQEISTRNDQTGETTQADQTDDAEHVASTGDTTRDKDSP